MQNNELDEEIGNILKNTTSNIINLLKYFIDEGANKNYLISPKIKFIKDQILNLKGIREIVKLEPNNRHDINLLTIEYKYKFKSLNQNKEKNKVVKVELANKFYL